MLDLFELPDVGAARRFASIPLSGSTMIHDFIATPKHLVFFAPPLRLKLLSLLFGGKSYSENLAWRPELGTEVIVVPIDHPEQVVRFTTEAFYQWHFANAFDQEDGRIVVDFVRLEDFTNNAYLGSLPRGGNGAEYRSRSARATLDLSAKKLATEIFSERSVEFPRISGSVAGHPHRYIYTAAHALVEDSRHGPFAQLMKQDRQTGTDSLISLGAEQIPSEPVFVRRPVSASEDDGWILSMTYDGKARESYLAVIDARRFQDGPVCRVHFDHAIPMSFHGNFARPRT
jgi:all-trans-8'-apo-beta-carotenal 15,15'-oxygenase